MSQRLRIHHFHGLLCVGARKHHFPNLFDKRQTTKHTHFIVNTRRKKVVLDVGYTENSEILRASVLHPEITIQGHQRRLFLMTNLRDLTPHNAQQSLKVSTLLLTTGIPTYILKNKLRSALLLRIDYIDSLRRWLPSLHRLTISYYVGVNILRSLRLDLLAQIMFSRWRRQVLPLKENKS